MNQAAKLIDHIESLNQSNGDDYSKVTHLDVYLTIIWSVQDIIEATGNRNLLNSELIKYPQTIWLSTPTGIAQRINSSDSMLTFSVPVCLIMSLSLSPLGTPSDLITFSQLLIRLILSLVKGLWNNPNWKVSGQIRTSTLLLVDYFKSQTSLWSTLGKSFDLDWVASPTLFILNPSL